MRFGNPFTLNDMVPQFSIAEMLVISLTAVRLKIAAPDFTSL